MVVAVVRLIYPGSGFSLLSFMWCLHGFEVAYFNGIVEHDLVEVEALGLFGQQFVDLLIRP